ncbi:hypothetical protein AKJ16_DCAP08469 [Drosera capensis]
MIDLTKPKPANQKRRKQIPRINSSPFPSSPRSQSSTHQRPLDLVHRSSIIDHRSSIGASKGRG